MTDLTPAERTPIDKADRIQAQHVAGIVRAMMDSSEKTYNQISFFEGDYLVRVVVQYEEALIALEAREKRLTEALRFYADEDNYWPSDGDDISDIQFDEGIRAREALEM